MPDKVLNHSSVFSKDNGQVFPDMLGHKNKKTKQKHKKKNRQKKQREKREAMRETPNIIRHLEEFPCGTRRNPTLDFEYLYLWIHARRTASA